MEDILHQYSLPYSQEIPLICMDEQPVQLIGEKRIPIQYPKKPTRYDYEYERLGTAVIFMFVDPLGGYRYVNVREQKTYVDWAIEIDHLLNTIYPKSSLVRLVCDNLNTHTTGALYETFSPEKARNLAGRIEIHYTPKHGSWLNMAEIELSVLKKQCLDRRIPDIETLQKEVRAWMVERNKDNKGINWQFTIGMARMKLHEIYPTIQK